MITVALDLSINSTGICIADNVNRTCKFIRLTEKSYIKSNIKGHKFVRQLHNAKAIAWAIGKLLLPYRNQQIRVCIETVGFGFLHQRTNSATDLLFEGAIVASHLYDLFECEVIYVEPTKHKKLFTGRGNADKGLSIAQMLYWFPQLSTASSKLDDLADAMSICTFVISDIRNYTCTGVYCL